MGPSLMIYSMTCVQIHIVLWFMLWFINSEIAQEIRIKIDNSVIFCVYVEILFEVSKNTIMFSERKWTETHVINELTAKYFFLQ